MTDGELVILGALLAAAGAIGMRIEAVLSRLRGNREIGAELICYLTCYAGVFVFATGLTRVVFK